VSGWSADRLLAGFEAKRLPFPDDYDGPVSATLVRLPHADAPRGAVLYVHGFIDYFFSATWRCGSRTKGTRSTHSTCESMGARSARISIRASARTWRNISPT
jgi:hypothetical protein